MVISFIKLIRPLFFLAVSVLMLGVILISFIFTALTAAQADEADGLDNNVMAGSCAPDCPGKNGPQSSFSVKKALAIAQLELGRQFPTGWNQQGECIKSVQRWINNSGGRFAMGGAVKGYLDSPALRVVDGSLRPGDVVQYENLATPDEFLYGVHTYMVLAVHEDGTHDLIESNFNFDGRVGMRFKQKLQAPAGFQVAVWRFAAEPDT